jgi:hypothetical protein
MSKWAYLLKDGDLDRWYRVTSRGGRLTAEVSLRRIGKACELLGLDPKGMVEAAQGDLMGFADRVDDMVTHLEEDGLSPGYVEDIVQSIKSWLKHNGIELTRRIVISNRGRTPTIESEQIPSKEELSRILRVCPPRVRVAAAFIALSDFRPQVLGDHWGQDGLKIMDLPELHIENGKVTFEVIPTIVKVRANLSKARHAYFSFLPEEGCTYLAEYLESRIREGEEITPESPVIGHIMREREVNPFIRTVKLGDVIRQAMRKAGVRKRPYVLRCYAETQLIIAESRGKISHPYLQFVAGHKGDIEARYSTNKGRLPPDMVEGMRQAYKECTPFLGTVAQPLEQSAIVKEAKLEALKSIAKSLLGIDLLEVKVAKERELEKELSVDDEIELFENEIKKMREQEKDPQIIVGEEELENHLADGWQFVSVLPSQRILIRKEY